MLTGTTGLNSLLRTIADSLNIPVIVILLLLAACTIVATGSVVVEFFTSHRYQRLHMPPMVDKIRNADGNVETVITESGLLKEHKQLLIELTKHPDITNDMRAALAQRLLEEAQAKRDKLVRITELFSKLAPMFGLLGTLIPLGPGIIALGQGDTFTLSQSLLTAFDTTIVGLIVAAVATVISTVRKSWYRNDMSVLETLTECVLEVEAHEVAE